MTLTHSACVIAARKRWVVYADTFNYNTSTIGSEWHGWMNYINDYNPSNYDFKTPKFAVAAYANRTGTPEAYAPKGAWANPEKRSWKKVEAWKPPVL